MNAWKKCSCSKWRNVFCERLVKYFDLKNYLGQSTGGNRLGDNYLEGNYPGDNYLDANCPGTIFLGSIDWGQLSGG